MKRRNRRKSFKWMIAIITAVLAAACIFITGCSSKKEQGPEIPEGFSFYEGSIDEGYVIIDGDGNEFVWVPVKELARYDFSAGQPAGDDPIDRIYYGEERKESMLYGTEYDISFFRDSVEKYGGFYVSRYEIGEGVVSKKDAAPYINVKRDEAFELCNGFRAGNGVKSTLINSYAWDSMLLWALEDGDPEKDVYKNIYGLGSGVSEWTTEYSSLGFYDDDADRVSRGNDHSDEEPDAKSRNYNFDVANEYTGFRMIIYFE